MTTLNKALVHLGFDENSDYLLGADESGHASIWEWHSELPQPTQEAIDQAKIDWQAEQDATQYQRDRQAEYPSVADFMEAYTEKEIGGSSTKWDAYVTAYNKVRTDNPKP